MPPELARLQRGFRANALQDIDAAGAPPPPSDLTGAIVAAGVPPERRLAIHRNHYATTLVDALAGIFEATRALLGGAYFDAFARRFARANPPCSPCLFEYGAALPAALAVAPGMAEHGYAADLARLEWAMHESFHAPAAPALAPSRLSALPADKIGDVRLRPRPSLRLVNAGFPVDDLWRQARAGDVEPGVLAGPPVWLLLLRPDFDVAMERTTEALYMLTTELAAGAALAEAAEKAAAQVEGFDFGATLGDCLTGGVFADDTGISP